MPSDAHIALQTALTAERDALKNFVALLEQEQNALVENVTDNLLEIAAQKSASALLLTDLVAARQGLLQRHIPALDAAAIQLWLQAQNPAILPLWQTIRSLAERARLLNLSSGELIQLKLRHNQQALTVLDNATRASNVYGPNGQTNFTPSSGRPLASV